MKTQPGPIAQHAVDVAERYLGTTEHGGNNRGPEVEAFLAAANLPPGQPWCCAFTRYNLEVSAKELDLEIPADYPDSGWCPAVQAWAKARGLWIPGGMVLIDRARRGDLALFHFPAKGRVAHIGHIAGVEPGQLLVTVEGNTAPPAEHFGGVEREGDGVYTKRHAWSALGVKGGLVRIPF